MRPTVAKCVHLGSLRAYKPEGKLPTPVSCLLLPVFSRFSSGSCTQSCPTFNMSVRDPLTNAIGNVIKVGAEAGDDVRTRTMATSVSQPHYTGVIPQYFANKAGTGTSAGSLPGTRSPHRHRFAPSRVTCRLRMQADENNGFMFSSCFCGRAPPREARFLLKATTHACFTAFAL